MGVLAVWVVNGVSQGPEDEIFVAFSSTACAASNAGVDRRLTTKIHDFLRSIIFQSFRRSDWRDLEAWLTRSTMAAWACVCCL